MATICRPSPRLASRARYLAGIPSSRGYYRGPVRVIRQASDFDKLQRGDVLVIPYSDVSWTPLFTRAGAVIAEAGGMLSHSSIVAREYNLPCVVSVPGACRLAGRGRSQRGRLRGRRARPSRRIEVLK